MNTYPELYSLSLNRFSCRSYSSQPVPEDAMMAVLDVARLAPSACNRQPWIFVIADTPDEREAVAQSYARDWIRTAPDISSHAVSMTRHGIAPTTERTIPMWTSL